MLRNVSKEHFRNEREMLLHTYPSTNALISSLTTFCYSASKIIQKQQDALRPRNKGSKKINGTGNSTYNLVEMVPLDFGDRIFLLHNNFNMILFGQLTIIKVTCLTTMSYL